MLGGQLPEAASAAPALGSLEQPRATSHASSVGAQSRTRSRTSSSALSRTSNVSPRLARVAGGWLRAASPALFRQKLLELAAEYDSLHAELAGRSDGLEASNAPVPATDSPLTRLEAPATLQAMGVADDGSAVDEGEADRPSPLSHCTSNADGTFDIVLDVPPCEGDTGDEPADATAALLPTPPASPQSGAHLQAELCVVEGAVVQSTLRSTLAERPSLHTLVSEAKGPADAVKTSAGLRGSDTCRSGCPSQGAESVLEASCSSSLTHPQKDDLPEYRRQSSFQSSREVRRFEYAVQGTSDALELRSHISGSGVTLRRLVESRTFGVMVALVILFSSLMIGVETHLLSTLSEHRPENGRSPMIFSILNYLSSFVMLLELALRIYAYRRAFFASCDIWNYFDLFIVIVSLVEICIEIVLLTVTAEDDDQNFLSAGGTVKVLRLLRLSRLLRLVRTIRELRPLRVLVQSIVFAGRSVFWALVLLALIIYAFGVLLTQATTEHLADAHDLEDEELLMFYGNLGRSMLSLWMAVAEGISWHVLIVPLSRVGGGMWVGVFMLYIAFVYFAVLNVVTGVFCQNAIESAQQDLDMVIQSQLQAKNTYVNHLKLLFQEMDTDQSNELSPAEFQQHLANPKVQSWFKAMDVDTSQVWRLFKILDPDDSGYIDITEFVDGCLRLRGSATRIDVESLKWEIKSVKQSLKRDSSSLDEQYSKLHSKLSAVLALLKRDDTAALPVSPTCSKRASM